MELKMVSSAGIPNGTGLDARAIAAAADTLFLPGTDVALDFNG
jgi:hypothetical protein